MEKALEGQTHESSAHPDGARKQGDIASPLEKAKAKDICGWPSYSVGIPDDIATDVAGVDLEWDVRSGRISILGVSTDLEHCTDWWKEEEHVPILRRLVARGTRLVGHNFVFAEYDKLEEVGIRVPEEQIEDTIILQWLLHNHLCKAGAGKDGELGLHAYMSLWTTLSLHSSWPYYKTCLGPRLCHGRPCPTHNPFWYNALDAYGSLLVLPQMLRQVRLRGLYDSYRFHIRLMLALLAVHRRGIHVDVEIVQRVTEEQMKRKERLLAGLPFNPRSPKQIAEYASSVGMTLKDTTSDTLKKAARENAMLASVYEARQEKADLKRWFAPRKWNSKKREWSGYVYEDGNVRPILGIYTSSGRMQCVKPNMQNLLRGENRRCVVAREGHYLLKADYQNAEGRVFFHEAGYEIPRDRDMHTFVKESLDIREDNPLAIKLGSARGAAKSVSHACLTGDHEVLTPDGWLRIAEWNGQKMAQWDTKGTIEFVAPSTFYKFGSTALIELKGRSFHQKVTTNHRLPVFSTGNWRHRHYENWRTYTADALPKSGRIPLTGVLTEPLKEQFSDLEIQQAVAIQADGSFNSSRVRFHLVRPRKIKRLRYLFPDAKIEKCADHTRGIQASVSWTSTLLNHKKEFTKELLQLSQRQRLVFLSELLLWDGCHSGRRKSFDNTDLVSVRWAQTIAHLAGREALLRKQKTPSGRKQMYRLSFNIRNFASIPELSKVKINVAQIEQVYCFSVPSSYFMVKYNDKISITGNSHYLEGLSLKRERALKCVRAAKELATGALVATRFGVFGAQMCFTGVNLAKRLYGASGYSERRAANEFVESYMTKFPKLRELQWKISKQAESGFIVTPTGHQLRSYGPALEERCKTACAVWGSEPVAKMAKEAMIRCFQQAHEKIVNILQVHDELLFEVSNDVAPATAASYVRSVMEIPLACWPDFILPTEIKAGRNWYDMEAVR